MVVAVSFRKASDPSYSSIVGAKDREGVCVNVHVSPCYPSKCESTEMLKTYFLPEILVVTLSVVAGPNPLEVDARIESW